MRGILDGLSDPIVHAEIERRSYIVGRLAEQTGVSREEASDALRHFENVTTSEGQTLQ